MLWVLKIFGDCKNMRVIRYMIDIRYILQDELVILFYSYNLFIYLSIYIYIYIIIIIIIIIKM